MDPETNKPLVEVSKDQMHTFSQVYILFLEKQKAKEVFEAKKEMINFQK